MNITYTENKDLWNTLVDVCDFENDHVPKHGSGYVDCKATYDGVEYYFNEDVIWDYNYGIDWTEYRHGSWVKIEKFAIPVGLQEFRILEMMKLQDGMNNRVNPNWMTAGYSFSLALMMESAEAIDHHGYKWWKLQNMDMPQLQMELVDIWHFAISHVLMHSRSELEALRMLTIREDRFVFDNTTYIYAEMPLLHSLRIMTGLAAFNVFNAGLFFHICQLCSLSPDKLYFDYIGKNALNLFRQDHGYKQGTYLKTWHGEEDNIFLIEAIKQLGNSLNYDTLTATLERIYHTATSGMEIDSVSSIVAKCISGEINVN